ncbi:MAG TPA: hypothetical protein DCQ31_16055, partial [Bacteroidales bacterium]|nr:hypothetical protein [Bacteroidales bacterium]
MKLYQLLATISIFLFSGAIFGQNPKILFVEKPDLNEVLNEDGINAIMEDKLGFLWIGGWNGLFRYDGNQTINYTSKYDGMLPKKIFCLYSASDSLVWIGTYGQGLFSFNISNNAIERFDSVGGLKLRNIYTIIEDTDKSIWIGTSENLLHYKNKKFSVFPLHQITNGKTNLLMITAIVKDKFGSFWIGSNNGVFRFNPATGKFLSVVPEISTYVSYMLGHNNKLWICSKSGLYSLIPEKDAYSNGNFFTINSRKIPEYIPSISVANFGTDSYWLTSQNNFYLINDKEKTSTPIQFYSGLNQKLNPLIQTSFENKNSILWLGSQHGVYKVDNKPKKFTSFFNNDA